MTEFKEAKQPTYATKWNRRTVPVPFAVRGRNLYEMCSGWLSPECADKDFGPGNQGRFYLNSGATAKTYRWLSFKPCWGTMEIVNDPITQGHVMFKAPGGTLFCMRGNDFRKHGCMDHVDHRQLTGHWEIKGEHGSLDMHDGYEYWSGKPYSHTYGTNYSFRLLWYLDNPMRRELKAWTRSVLDAIPEPITWHDYWTLRTKDGQDSGCKKGDWPERPKGIHGWSPQDMEPCYHVERDWFMDSTQDMRLVPYPECVNYPVNPTKLIPIRVKLSTRKRKRMEAKAQQIGTK